MTTPVGQTTVAKQLTLDDEGELAFVRLSNSLPLVASILKALGEDMVIVPPEKVEAGVDTIISDLETISSQIHDAALKARVVAARETLTRLAVPQNKATTNCKKLSLEVEGDDEDQLLSLLSHIGKTAGIGHSFPVVVDPEDSEYRKQFHFDGDGSFRLNVGKADLSTGQLADQGGLLQPAQGGSRRFRKIPVNEAVFAILDVETFKIAGVFGSEGAADEGIAKLESGEEAEAPEHQFAILSKAEQDERTVLGIVLEPETVDSQNDIYSPEEIRKTAYRFMERYQQFGLMHKQIVPSILPLESYLAPVDFEINGQKVKKGTWVLRVRVLDDQIWAKVKSGELTGFSIGGSATRTPDVVEA